MVSTCLFISKSTLFTKVLGIVPSAPIGITVTFMFHSFFSSQARSNNSSLFLIFTLCSARMAKSTIWQVFFCWPSLDLVFWTGLADLFLSQNQNVCMSASVCMWLSGIIAITNSNGDCTSPRNIPLWIFSTAKLFSSAVSSIFQFFMVSSINLTTPSDILYILRLSIIQFCRTVYYTALRDCILCFL